MGIKLRLLLLLFLLVCKIGHSQNNRKIANLTYLKEYAFCNCLNANYLKIDSNFFKNIRDQSQGTYFGDFLEIRLEQKLILDSFINSETSTFYLNTKSPFIEVSHPKNNNIILFCFEFYRSQKLDKFIRKLMK